MPSSASTAATKIRSYGRSATEAAGSWQAISCAAAGNATEVSRSRRERIQSARRNNSDTLSSSSWHEDARANFCLARRAGRAVHLLGSGDLNRNLNCSELLHAKPGLAVDLRPLVAAVGDLGEPQANLRDHDLINARAGARAHRAARVVERELILI